MSDIMNEVELDLTNPEVVDNLLDNKDLRKLPVGSDEFKAAARESLAKTDATTDVSADSEKNDSSDENTEETTEDDTNVDRPKKSRGMLKRIEGLVAEREALKQQLGELQARQTAPNEYQPPAQQSTYDQPKPLFKDFDTLEEYTEALTDWKLDKKDHDREVTKQHEEYQDRVKSIVSTWEQREAQTKELYPDYADLVNVQNLTTLNPSMDAKVFLSESEVGPKVLYALMSDESLLEKFVDASPVRQVAMLAKLEDRVAESDEDTPVVKKSTISKAPQPVKALPKGKAVATVKDVYNPDLSFEEYNRLMDERERLRKGK
jgi:hypothetical protein